MPVFGETKKFVISYVSEEAITIASPSNASAITKVDTNTVVDLTSATTVTLLTGGLGYKVECLVPFDFYGAAEIKIIVGFRDASMRLMYKNHSVPIFCTLTDVYELSLSSAQLTSADVSQLVFDLDLKAVVDNIFRDIIPSTCSGISNYTAVTDKKTFDQALRAFMTYNYWDLSGTPRGEVIEIRTHNDALKFMPKGGKPTVEAASYFERGIEILKGLYANCFATTGLGLFSKTTLKLPEGRGENMRIPSIIRTIHKKVMLTEDVVVLTHSQTKDSFGVPSDETLTTLALVKGSFTSNARVPRDYEERQGMSEITSSDYTFSLDWGAMTLESPPRLLRQAIKRGDILYTLSNPIHRYVCQYSSSSGDMITTYVYCSYLEK